jgi:hypothetical protein
MDAEKSFTFPFEDEEWLSKLGLGVIILFIPILNFAWSGYLVDIIRNVITGNPKPLPTWDDLGKKFNEGLILFGAFLIYASPILAALCLPFGIMASSGFLSGNSNTQDLNRVITEAGGILLFGLLCVSLLYGLVLSILYPAILILFARDGTFASCFRLREALVLIRRNAGPFFTAWALGLAVGLGTSLLAGFANLVVGFVPCIGWVIGLALSFASSVYTNIVYAHLFGQFGRTVFTGDQLVPTS